MADAVGHGGEHVNAVAKGQSTYIIEPPQTIADPLRSISFSAIARASSSKRAAL